MLFLDLQHNVFQTYLHKFSYICESISVMNKGSEGPYLVRNLRVPKMSQKGIAIHPETYKLAILEWSKTIRNKKTIRNLRNPKNRLSLPPYITSIYSECWQQFVRPVPPSSRRYNRALSKLVLVHLGLGSCLFFGRKKMHFLFYLNSHSFPGFVS